MTNNIRWERKPKKNCWAGEDSHTCARGIIVRQDFTQRFLLMARKGLLALQRR
jgi:hypothetical protein